MTDFRDYDILTLPGWHNSGADHWQTHWERALPATRRIEHQDWDTPTYAEWSKSLSRTVAASDRPIVVVAHSLGTSLITRWAIETGGEGVAAAFLVATTDRDRWDNEPGEPQGFGPMLLQPLPFPSTVVASTDDPRCSFERSKTFAAAWNSRFIDAAALGHMGSAANLMLWPSALVWLGELVSRIERQN